MTARVRWSLVAVALVVATSSCAKCGGSSSENKTAPSASKPAASAAKLPPPLPPPDRGDALERLVARLSRTHRWETTGSTFDTQPETATPEQVLAEVFKKTSYREGKITTFAITTARPVMIAVPQSGAVDAGAPVPYTAVQMTTNLGPRLAVIRYLGKGKGGWFNYVVADDTPDGG